MLNGKKIVNIVCGFMILGLSSFSFADMILDGESSSLSFVSVKKGAIGESHSIAKLSGSLSSSGDLKVVLDLKSVNTNIPVRDERMNKVLFETEKYPEAILTAKITDDLSTDGIKTIQTEATLEMHGVTQKVMVETTVMRAGDQLVATSTKPVIIAAGDYKLAEGIARLQALAKLPSIALAVPVNFVLVFKK